LVYWVAFNTIYIRYNSSDIRNSSHFFPYTMFARIKKSGNHEYLQIVESYRQEGKVKQRMIASLGNIDDLTQDRNIEQIMESLEDFAEEASDYTFAYTVKGVREGFEDATVVHD